MAKPLNAIFILACLSSTALGQLSQIPAASGGGGGSPGGSNTQVQFNNSGSFAGSSSLIWNNSTGTFAIGDSLGGAGGRLFVQHTSAATSPFYPVQIINTPTGLTGALNNRTQSIISTFGLSGATTGSSFTGGVYVNSYCRPQGGSDVLTHCWGGVDRLYLGGASGSTGTEHAGSYADTQVEAAFAGTVSALGNYWSPGLNIGNNAGGTITRFANFYAGASTRGTGTTTVVTNHYGLYVPASVYTGGIGGTRNVGVNIGGDCGSTGAYALCVNDGSIRLRGRIDGTQGDSLTTITGTESFLTVGGTIGTGSTGTVRGGLFNPTSNVSSGNTLAALAGVRIDTRSGGTGTVTANTALQVRAQNDGTGTTGTLTGIDIEPLVNAGTISGLTYALRIRDQSTGTQSGAIYAIASEDTNAHVAFAGRGIFGAVAVPNSFAALEIQSTTGGLLLPRMTTTAGLVIYNTTLSKIQVYTTAWETVTSV
jgi:hypothetical protein